VACGAQEQRARPETAAPGAWSTKAELPTPRTELSVAALGGRIYAAGGFTASGEATDVVEVYDPRADAWGRSLPLPVALHHTGLASARGRLYVVGGYTSGGNASDGVWSWAVDEERWREEPRLPTARGALAVAVVEAADTTMIHAAGGATAFGGDSPRLSGAHEALDVESGEWGALAPLPAPRDHLAAASADGKLHVVGGRLLSLATNQSRLDVFDPRQGRWSSGADLPTARGGLAAAAAGGRVCVFGGEEPSGTFDAAECLDVASGRWSAVDPLPTARHGLGAAAVDGRLYVVGGGPTPGLSTSGANEALTLEG
jgi:N-acetylneuraminic acid mutarotase